MVPEDRQRAEGQARDRAERAGFKNPPLSLCEVIAEYERDESNGWANVMRTSADGACVRGAAYARRRRRRGPCRRGSINEGGTTPAPEKRPRAEDRARDRTERAGFKNPPLSVCEVIAEYQRDENSGWANRDYFVWLRYWCGKFITGFQLKTKDGRLLPLPVIKIEPLDMRTISSYRAKRDGYGIGGTIVVNEERLKQKEFPEDLLLAHLLRALMLAWQQERCADELFDVESRERFRKLGLKRIKDSTRIRIEEGGRFQELLRQDGIKTGDGYTLPKPSSRSTLALWSCLCQKVRVGTRCFSARCLGGIQELRPTFVGNPPESGR